VIQAAEADVVRPAVAADDPDRLDDEHVDQARQLFGLSVGVGGGCQASLSSATRRAERDIGLRCLRGGEDAVCQLVTDQSAQPLYQLAAYWVCLSIVRRKPKPNSALSSNRLFDQAGAASGSWPRRGRQVAAIDRGAPGCVGDDRPVAKELAEQLDVGCFAAAGARAGIFEQGPSNWNP